MTIKEIIHDTDIKMKKTVENTQRELGTIRTGRASASVVEGVRVDYYGTPTPLKQLGAISTPDPKLIVIQPWDKNALADIEKAIMKSDLGLTPTNDGKVIRLAVPSLTTERKAELDKIVKKLAEDGRVSIRTCRHSAIEHIKKLEKDKVVAEDDSFRAQEDVQKLTDKHIKDIETSLANKEKEIS